MSRVLRAASLLVAGGVAIGLARCASDPPEAAPPAAEAGRGGTGGGWKWDAGVYDALVADAPPPMDAPTDTATLDADTAGYEWLFGDAWTPVETLPGCDSAVADVKKLAWPGFVWESCGEGCQRSDAVTGPKMVFKGAASTGSGSKLVDGELVLYLAAGVRLPPAAQWVAALRASDDSVLSILRTYGDNCTPSFSGRYTRLIQIHGGVGKAALLHATASGVTQAAPLASTSSPSRYFDLDDGWGPIRGQAWMGISEQSDSATFTHVYSAPGTANFPKGLGKAVFWRDWTNAARLHVWTKAGGPRKLVEGPYHALAFAVAPDRLAWLAVTGDPLFNVFTSAALHSSPLALDPDALVLEPGIPLPIIKFGEPMYLAGKWVVIAGDGGLQQILVNLDTKEVWGIDAPAGHFQTPLGVSDTTLFVTDSPPGSVQPSQKFHHLLRYDLAKLPAYGKKL